MVGITVVGIASLCCYGYTPHAVSYAILYNERRFAVRRSIKILIDVCFLSFFIERQSGHECLQP